VTVIYSELRFRRASSANRRSSKAGETRKLVQTGEHGREIEQFLLCRPVQHATGASNHETKPYSLLDTLAFVHEHQVRFDLQGEQNRIVSESHRVRPDQGVIVSPGQTVGTTARFQAMREVGRSTVSQHQAFEAD
jgi:hypothetical protein